MGFIEGKTCPRTTRNLITMNHIDNYEYATMFGGESWKVSKGILVVTRGKKVETCT